MKLKYRFTYISLIRIVLFQVFWLPFSSYIFHSLCVYEFTYCKYRNIIKNFTLLVISLKNNFGLFFFSISYASCLPVFLPQIQISWEKWMAGKCLSMTKYSKELLTCHFQNQTWLKCFFSVRFHMNTLDE